ncbi:hypothetical protein DERP_001022 [Dermatophagoides pteronyssinus]|uniref:Uncharacterized protein n=1 Tax=Dermatophagoides pteronyssinus TaxID=6956 RepID=A0ABQ8JE08_DERPT|nr:hypothetical protein DERP_001022 [Dermatophagoides pteronyssinus]
MYNTWMVHFLWIEKFYYSFLPSDIVPMKPDDEYKHYFVSLSLAIVPIPNGQIDQLQLAD